MTKIVESKRGAQHDGQKDKEQNKLLKKIDTIKKQIDKNLKMADKLVKDNDKLLQKLNNLVKELKVSLGVE